MNYKTTNRRSDINYAAVFACLPTEYYFWHKLVRKTCELTGLSYKDAQHALGVLNAEGRLDIKYNLRDEALYKRQDYWRTDT